MLRQSCPTEVSLLGQALLKHPALTEGSRGYLLLAQAEFACLQGELAKAKNLATQARECLGTAPNGLADLAWVQAQIAGDAGDNTERNRWMQESLALALKSGDVHRIDTCRIASACFEAVRHSATAAKVWLDTIRPLLKSADPACLAFSNFFMRLIAQGRGEYSEALAHALAAQRFAEQCGQVRRALVEGCTAAGIMVDLGDLESAVSHLEALLPQARSCGWPHPLGLCLSGLAYAVLRMERNEAALALAQESVQALSAFPRSTHYMSVLTTLGEAALACGRDKVAYDCYTILASPDNPSEFGEHRRHGLLGLAQLAARAADPTAAEKLCLAALELNVETTDYAFHVELLRLLSRVTDQDLSKDKPLALLRQAIALTDRHLSGSKRHLLETDLSAVLEQRGQAIEALSVLKSAMESLAADRLRAATQRVLALEVRFRTEHALAEAETHRKAAQAESKRAAELELLNRQLQEAHAQIRDLSLTDPLTGLRNRRFFAQVIGTVVAETLRSHHGSGESPSATPSDLTLFLLDLDHFKRINDDHGHAAGDAVLAQLGERLRVAMREQDLLVRWGGEEFLVVVRGTHRKESLVIAERLRRAISDQPFAIGQGKLLPATGSIGFAAFPQDAANPTAGTWEQALELADARLYQAKQQGRNCWVGDAIDPA